MGRSGPGQGGGYRIAVKMETSIKLICQPFGHCVVPLDEPDCSQQERDLETCSKNQHKTWRHTNKQANCVSTLFSRAQKRRNKRRVVKIHSSLVVLLLKFGKQTGGVRLNFRLGHISQETPHSQGRAMARPKFIVLGFPEQGFVLSLGFTAFATNECPFYNYNTPGLCPCSRMSF